MPAEEFEVTIEVICTRLPGLRWGDHSPLHLGIQKDEAMEEAQPADRERIVFKPVLRVRRQKSGAPNFLGPYAHGKPGERFIYLNWASMSPGIPAVMIGRVKLHLNHLGWTEVERAAQRDKPLKVTLALTSAKGGPVFASVRQDLARWQP